ncbi:MAG: penicillin-binding protein 1B [Gammaproteobacteria bacterium]
MSRKSSSKSRGRRWVFALLAIALLTLTVVGSTYVAYLDRTVRTQFEGKRWALPARVYARPLELFQGMTLSPSQLAAELTELGYVRTGTADSPGTYQESKTEFRLVTRAFRFWDTAEPSLAVRAQFKGHTITALQNAANGADLDIVRLDPVLIGSIYPAHNEDRVLVQLKEVPSLLIQALLAVEDRRFYQHHGIDPVALMRALWSNVRARSAVQGGSTLTQQLAKNFYLTPQRTFSRKANEAIMALLLEAHYSKGEILEAYLNEIFLGQEGDRAIHGFGLASYFYFGRPLSELKLPQHALLVSLARGASYYDPRKHPQRAVTRRNRIIDLLAASGGITAEQATAAKKTSLGVTPKIPSGISPYPAFMDLVRRQLQSDYKEEDLTSEGLQIFTTLDPRIQATAEGSLTKRAGQLEKAYKIPQGYLEGAALVTGSQNGEVLAMVGSRDARFSGFNRALDATRPIGSLVKPAVYLTALARPQNYTLASLLDDGPLRVPSRGGKTWQPQNYDHQYHGFVPLHSALAHSYNISTVRLGLAVGVPNVLDTLYSLGLSRKFPPYPSLLLGAIDLTPVEVTQIYQTLASGGFRVPLRAIRDVLTTTGEPLQRYSLSIEAAFDPAAIYLLNTALKEVVSNGTASSVSKVLPDGISVAGKTGTTDDSRDSWFAGFSGQHVAVVWLGRDDNKPTGLTGATGALKVWGDIMSVTATQSLQLLQPENVEFVRIDGQTEQLASNTCPGAVQLPFINGSAPRDVSTCGQNDYDDYENQRDDRPRSTENPHDWLKEIFR